MSILIVANPTSGAGCGKNLLDETLSNPACLLSLAQLCGVKNEPKLWPFLTTTPDSSPDSSWKIELEGALKTQNLKAVLVIGGDGTLLEVATLLSQHPDVSLVAIPGGRGNDFVRGFYGYENHGKSFWSWCADQNLHWEKQKIDLGCANGKIYLNMASLGYGGHIVEKALHRHAFWSQTSAVYQVEGALALCQWVEVPCKIEVEVERSSASSSKELVYQGPFYGAFIANGKTNGSGLFWTPEADLMDGKLDCIWFQKPGVFEMLKSLSLVKIKQNPSFPYQRAQYKEVIFHFEKPIPLELDGEWIGSFTQHRFFCLPQSLSVCMLKK